MLASGIIYQAHSRAKVFFYFILRGIGAGFIAFAVTGIIFIYYPVFKEEISFRSGKGEARGGFGDILSRIGAKEFGLDPYFSIYIPAIDARAKVTPNVNPGDRKEYLSALTKGVAHARGSNFPGGGESIYLFSHSTDSPLNFTRFNAVFYLLRKLEKGDRIIVFFMSGRHEYEVTDRVITSATDTSWLNDKGSGERLILQTCDPPGTTLNRLIVIARPIQRPEMK